MSELPTSDLVAGIEPSATLALNARVKQMASEGKKVYNLSVGELSCDTPAYIQEYVKKHLEQNKYTPAAGLNELREKTSSYVKDFYNVKWVNKANIVVTPSVKPAIWASLTTLLNPNDEIILPVPTWVSYKHIIHSVRAKVITTQLTPSFDIDPSDIESKITPKTKAILLNSPQNPTGAIYSAESLNKLVNIANEHNITVLSDEIYSRLVYDKNYRPASSFGFNNLIILDGFSKSQALTGWRIGYMVAEAKFAAACTSLLSQNIGNAPVLSQYAALSALERNNEPVMFEQLKANLELSCSLLDSINKVSYQRPSGAFYIFLDLRQMTDNDTKWCEDLLQQTGVALVAGSEFFAPGFARMSFAVDQATLSEAINLIKEFVSKNYA